ncbi:AAA family ATPase [Amniculibacterium sp. G2-70]|uniref:AAA family ATPase n=1 Tax=Amniculibacterium sp. G2-70 TaxID=2767188 RepID=UPI0016541497|nr:AAA family ATPase [Amniculibacterium sp. G2-70]
MSELKLTTSSTAEIPNLKTADYKAKSTVILLTLFTGFGGGHRFYLGQTWLGIFYLIFNWTLIPLVISVIDLLVFIFISEKKFNDKYNRNVDFSKVESCAACKKHLTLLNKPMWGLGKLNDGKSVCYSCFSGMLKIDRNFNTNSQQKYSAKEVENYYAYGFPKSRLESRMQEKVDARKEVLAQKQEELKNIFTSHSYTMKSELHTQYLQLLEDFSKELDGLYKNLIRDKKIEEMFRESSPNLDPQQVVLSILIYDLLQIGKFIKGDFLSPDDAEAFGVFLLVQGFLPEKITGIHWDFKSLQASSERKIYNQVIREVLKIGEGESLMNISFNVEEGNPKPEIAKENTLAFPTFLQLTENPVLEQYATALYRFANIIAKADGNVNIQEEQKLKKVYQFLHKPLEASETTFVKVQQPKTNENMESVLEELHQLIGLENVKEEVNTLINFIKIQKAREQNGLKTSPISYHIIFTGNPGTGKTTVARIIAKLYKHLGILYDGHFIETDRSGLIAQFTGQTAPKVNKVVDSALNGVLFIDEAYALVGEHQDDFGKEAVATLIKRIEDNRDQLVVIMAGYGEEMKTFIDTNPGFQSRFNRYIHFQDYNAEELLKIFESLCKKLDYNLTTDAQNKLKEVFETAFQNKDENFGNARFVRNIFEKTLENQANRIAKKAVLSKAILSTIELEDVEIFTIEIS